MSKEPSFVCKLYAMSAAQRARHSELAARLADAVSERRELADGYALRVAVEKIDLAAAAEWITLERRCCPFLRFQLEAEPDDGPVWLRLTGATGVKEFLAVNSVADEELHAQSLPAHA
jgi:hypothetical protein